MEESDNINYNRVAAAIAFIKSNFKDQPKLEEVAEKVHLSPYQGIGYFYNKMHCCSLKMTGVN